MLPGPEIKRASVKLQRQQEKEVTAFSYPGVVYLSELPSYDELFRNIFTKNQLCVVGPGITAQWKSRQLWVAEDGTPDFEYISRTFGDATGPVANCNGEEFCAHPKTAMKVKDYIHYWRQYKADGYPSEEKCLYLKDWHFTKRFPNYFAYKTPEFLCSDWLNEFYDSVESEQGIDDDYRFVYMGPKGSWTPFHSDVLRSYSWSANICGRKKWIFFPPGVEQMLKDPYGQLIFDLRSDELADVRKYPRAGRALEQAVVVIQNPGEIVFVPSGWHHQVFNLEDTISINHNWMNGCSIQHTWSFLKTQLVAVQREIADCRDMDGWDKQCQMILKADAGMDYNSLYMFLTAIARNRLLALRDYLQAKYCSKYTGESPAKRSLNRQEFEDSAGKRSPNRQGFKDRPGNCCGVKNKKRKLFTDPIESSNDWIDFLCHTDSKETRDVSRGSPATGQYESFGCCDRVQQDHPLQRLREDEQGGSPADSVESERDGWQKHHMKSQVVECQNNERKRPQGLCQNSCVENKLVEYQNNHVGNEEGEFKDLYIGDQQRKHRDSWEEGEKGRSENNHVGNQQDESQDILVGNQRVENQDSNIGNQQSESQDSNIGNQRIENQDSNIGNQQSESQDSNIGNQQSENQDSNIGNQRIENQDSNIGNQWLENQDSNIGNQQSESQDSNIGNQQSKSQDSNIGNQWLESQDSNVRYQWLESQDSHLSYHDFAGENIREAEQDESPDDPLSIQQKLHESRSVKAQADSPQERQRDLQLEKHQGNSSSTPGNSILNHKASQESQPQDDDGNSSVQESTPSKVNNKPRTLIPDFSMSPRWPQANFDVCRDAVLVSSAYLKSAWDTLNSDVLPLLLKPDSEEELSEQYTYEEEPNTGPEYEEEPEDPREYEPEPDENLPDSGGGVCGGFSLGKTVFSTLQCPTTGKQPLKPKPGAGSTDYTVPLAKTGSGNIPTSRHGAALAASVSDGAVNDTPASSRLCYINSPATTSTDTLSSAKSSTRDVASQGSCPCESAFAQLAYTRCNPFTDGMTFARFSSAAGTLASAYMGAPLWAPLSVPVGPFPQGRQFSGNITPQQFDTSSALTRASSETSDVGVQFSPKPDEQTPSTSGSIQSPLSPAGDKSKPNFNSKDSLVAELLKHKQNSAGKISDERLNFTKNNLDNGQIASFESSEVKVDIEDVDSRDGRSEDEGNIGENPASSSIRDTSTAFFTSETSSPQEICRSQQSLSTWQTNLGPNLNLFTPSCCVCYRATGQYSQGHAKFESRSSSRYRIKHDELCSDLDSWHRARLSQATNTNQPNNKVLCWDCYCHGLSQGSWYEETHRMKTRNSSVKDLRGNATGRKVCPNVSPKKTSVLCLNTQTVLPIESISNTCNSPTCDRNDPSTKLSNGQIVHVNKGTGESPPLDRPSQLQSLSGEEACKVEPKNRAFVEKEKDSTSPILKDTSAGSHSFPSTSDRNSLHLTLRSEVCPSHDELSSSVQFDSYRKSPKISTHLLTNLSSPNPKDDVQDLNEKSLNSALHVSKLEPVILSMKQNLWSSPKSFDGNLCDREPTSLPQKKILINEPSHRKLRRFQYSRARQKKIHLLKKRDASYTALCKLLDDRAKNHEDLSLLLPRQGNSKSVRTTDSEISENKDSEISENKDSEISENKDSEIYENKDSEIYENKDLPLELDPRLFSSRVSKASSNIQDENEGSRNNNFFTDTADTSNLSSVPSPAESSAVISRRRSLPNVAKIPTNPNSEESTAPSLPFHEQRSLSEPKLNIALNSKVTKERYSSEGRNPPQMVAVNGRKSGQFFFLRHHMQSKSHKKKEKPEASSMFSSFSSSQGPSWDSRSSLSSDHPKNAITDSKPQRFSATVRRLKDAFVSPKSVISPMSPKPTETSKVVPIYPAGSSFKAKVPVQSNLVVSSAPDVKWSPSVRSYLSKGQVNNIEVSTSVDGTQLVREKQICDRPGGTLGSCSLCESAQYFIRTSIAGDSQSGSREPKCRNWKSKMLRKWKSLCCVQSSSILSSLSSTEYSSLTEIQSHSSATSFDDSSILWEKGSPSAGTSLDKITPARIEKPLLKPQNKTVALEVTSPREDLLDKTAEEAAPVQDPTNTSETQKKTSLIFSFYSSIISLSGGTQNPGRRNLSPQRSPPETPSSKAVNHNTSAAPSDQDHRLCPHWAHCGPNLALFDLQKVAEVLRDLRAQPEFPAVRDSLPAYLPQLESWIEDLSREMEETCGLASNSS